MKIEIELIEEMLGTKAANKDVFADFIASKAPDGDKRKEELDTAEHREEAGTTVFHKQDGQVGIWNYQLKGLLKDACSACNRMDKENRNGLDKLTAYKSKIDGVIFVEPRFLIAQLPEGQTIGICERPLRADTAQGPRVSVCRSETLPAGTKFQCEIKILTKELIPYVELWLNYGKLRGLGAWRNSGKGSFAWKEVE